MNRLKELREMHGWSMKEAAQKLGIPYTTYLSGLPQDVAKMSLLQAIVEQNWIIIRQLDKLNSK